MSKKQLPRVTIVTPSFNQAGFLGQTMLSVLNQDYPNIEYIVIDGGSKDGSVEIIKKYQHKLAYWVSESDEGQSNAINKGFQHATTEIFCWLNSDDLLMPDAVRIAVDYLVNKPDIGVVYGDRITIDQQGNFLSVTEVPSYNKKIFKYHLRIPQETVFFRKIFWDQVGGLKEDLNFCMDYDFFVKLSKVTEFYHIPFVLGAWRRHNSAKTVVYSKSMKIEGEEEIEKTYLNNYSKKRSRFLKKVCKKVNRIRLFLEKASTSREREVEKIHKIIDQTI